MIGPPRLPAPFGLQNGIGWAETKTRRSGRNTSAIPGKPSEFAHSRTSGTYEHALTITADVEKKWSLCSVVCSSQKSCATHPRVNGPGSQFALEVRGSRLPTNAAVLRKHNDVEIELDSLSRLS
ncbi:hypothetical protein MKZ38_001064 [Zalerion maritima]|uniref:Uncharacterized protein n=1 Tax=Zalerion maritima TaxID=339359 RepID=A0AAD5WLL2_9PEZI|nr:hypothetical protein MKZ38_001064 [Zalerion maritima]